MALKIFKNPRDARLERTLIYAAPKAGKTRLATSLPDHMGKILYLAEDENSKYLDSVLNKYRDRIIVMEQEGKDSPIHNAMEAASRNWKKDLDPEIGTIVVDTFTKMTNNWLKYVANEGMFSSEKHIQIGTPGTKGFVNIPMQGDFMAVQALQNNFLDMLFQQDLNVLVLCHEYLDTPEGGAAKGGPATVGKATIRSLPGKFNTVIRLDTKNIPAQAGKPAQQKIVARTENHGAYVAGIRTGHATNPIPSIELQPDPINFWNDYFKTINTEGTK